MPASPEAVRDSSLRELQRQFMREVLYRDSPEVAAQIVANGLSVERRLAIYRTNARETFALALEAAFPLLLGCVGPEEFRSLAWAYQQACPSPAGNLFHTGRRLPGFLADHVRGTPDEDLIDVARLEWAVQESLWAADSDTALDLAALAAVPVEHQADLQFFLHPSVRLMRFEYGVFGPWEARQAGKPVARAVAGPENLLVRRLAAGVQLQKLGELDLAWLAALQDGASLADSAAALPLMAQDELGALLVRWVSAGVVTGFTARRQSAGEELT